MQEKLTPGATARHVQLRASRLRTTAMSRESGERATIIGTPGAENSNELLQQLMRA